MKKINYFKRFLSVLLTVLMMITLLPASVFAANNYVIGEGIYADSVSIEITDGKNVYNYKSEYPSKGGAYDHTQAPVTTSNIPNSGVNDKATILLTLAFSPKGSGVKLESGDVITFRLPVEFNSKTVSEGIVQDGGGDRMGVYSVINGLVTIKYDDAYIEDCLGEIVDGTLTITGEANFDGKGGKIPFKIGEHIFDIPVKEVVVPYKSTGSISKSAGNITKGNDGKYYVDYIVKLKADSGNTEPLALSRVVINDRLSSSNPNSQQYIDSIEIITSQAKGSVTISREANNHGIDWTFSENDGTLSNGSELSVKYRCYLNESFNSVPYNKPIKNNATLKIDDKKVGNTQSVSKSLSGNLNVDKSSGYIYRKDGKYYIDYTIEVYAKDSANALDDVTVTDVFTDGKDYVVGVSAIEPAGGIYDATNKTVTWTGLTVQNNQSKKTRLTFTAELSRDIVLQGSTGESSAQIKNTASASRPGVNRQTKDYTAVITKKWAVKEGEMQDNGTVRFDYKANSPVVSRVNNKDVYRNILDGGELTMRDILGTGWLYCDSTGSTSGNLIASRYTVTENNTLSPADTIVIPLRLGNQETKFGRFTLENKTDEKGKVHQEFTLEGSGDYYYELLYYAVPTPENWGASITNKAGVGIDGGATQFWHEYGYEGQNMKAVVIEKEGTGVDIYTKTAGWRIELRHEVENGMTVVDTRSNTQNNAMFYLNSDQLDAITIKVGDKLVDKGKYTVVGNDPEKSTSFTVTFKEELGSSYNNPVVIEFRTDVEGLDGLNQEESITYTNDAVCSDKNGNTASASGVNTYKKDRNLSKSVFTHDAIDYDDDGVEDYIIMWNVRINQEGTLEGSATLTDYIPQGTEYMGYYAMHPGANANDVTVSEPVQEITENGRVTETFTIGGLKKTGDDSCTVDIVIVTKVVDKDALVSNGKLNIQNDAELVYRGGRSTALAVYDETISTVTKEGFYNGEKDLMNMHFKVVVNPDSLDMIQGNDKDSNKYIKVTDSMNNNISLLAETIKITDANGVTVFDNSKTDNDNSIVRNLQITNSGFSFEILDNAKYVVTYDVSLMGNPGDTLKNVTNKVTYEGYKDGAVYDKPVTIYKSASSADGIPSFSIKKYGANSRKLYDAEFTLYKVTVNNEGTVTYTQVGAPAVVTQNAKAKLDGAASFSNLERGVVYAFRETKTVDGYYLDENVSKYTYLIFRKTVKGVDQTPNIIKDYPEDIKEAIRSVNAGQSFNVKNEPTEVTVEKTFEGYAADGNYYFGLFTSENERSTDKISTLIVDNGEVKTPAKFIELTDGTYYVYEVDANGNKISDAVINDVHYVVSGGGAVTVNAETNPTPSVQITNKALSDLTINKALVGGETRGTFKFTVMGADGKYYDQQGVAHEVTPTATAPVITLNCSTNNDGSVGGSVTVANLPIQQYVVSEVIGDSVRYNVTYSKDGGLVDVVATETAEITVTNELRTGELEVKKSVEGAGAPSDKEFEFTITLKNKDGQPVVGEYSGLTFNEDGKATFKLTNNGSKKIEGLEDGVSYKVEEKDYSDVGFTSDLGNNANGKIEAGKTSTVEVKNTYKADPVSVRFTATKVFNPADGTTRKLGDLEFTFELKDSKKEVIDTKKNGEGVGVADTEVVFDEIEYTEVGTYNYTISEKAGTRGGVTYDPVVYKVKVDVTDNHVGQLEREVTITKAVENDEDTAVSMTVNGSDVPAVVFENTYKASDAVVVLGGTKTLKDFPEGSKYTYNFEFKLIENGKVIDTKTVEGMGSDKASETFAFDKIVYTSVGKHTYTVVETTGKDGPHGITYSSVEHTVEVEVTDNHDGQFVAEVTEEYSKGSGLDFTNTYKARPTDVVFTAHKKFSSDSPASRPLKLGEFSFTLSGGENTNETVRNGLYGGVVFTKIVFTKAGTYNFTLKENVPARKLGGVTYDESVYNITVDVTDPGDGQLVRKVTVTKDNETVSETADGHYVPTMGFVNKYEAKPVKVSLGGTKTLADFPAGSDYTYDFEFVLMEGRKEIDRQIVSDMGSDLTHASYKFDDIEYTKVGVHTYTVKEIKGNDEANGITYSTVTRTVNVVVTDDQNGNLVATVTPAYSHGTGLDFTNTYEAKPVSVQFEADKTLIAALGTTRKLEAGEFELELRNVFGRVIQTKKNNADGSVSFDPITYTEAGVYNYAVTEKAPNILRNKDGVTYDASVYNITVTVTDPGDGQLVKSVAVRKNGRNVDDISFTNLYTAKPVKVSLGGTKTLADFPAGSSKTYDFRFVLMEGFRVIDTQTVRGMGSEAAIKNIKFDDIEYRGVGEHTYTVVEIKGNDERNGITYSNVRHTVKVVVTDDHRGNLVATVTPEYSNGSGLDFTNTYKAKPVSVKFGGTKTLSDFPAGSDVDCSFTFTLSKAGETAVLDQKTVVLGSDKASGSYAFAKTYDAVTTETFVVKETVADQNGITYDEEEYTVTVTVSDPGDGQLVASVTAKDSAGNDIDTTKIDFNNVYKAHPVSVEFKGIKTLTSLGDVRKIKANEFEFVLSEVTEGGQTVIETVRNDEVGAIKFSPIKYEETGKHVYLVSESDLGDYGIEYSKTTYIIEVDVYDDGTGDLKYETKVVKNLDPASQIMPMVDLGEEDPVTEVPAVVIAEEATITTLNFENIYHHGDLAISKTVSGEIASKTKLFDFTVRLYDEEGNELDETFAYEYEIFADKVLKEDIDREFTGVISSGDVFKLRHGESIVIRNLPVGVSYSVEENKESRRGYKMHVSGNEGVIYECEEGEYIDVFFRNSKHNPNEWPIDPNTGEHYDPYKVPNTSAK